MRQRRWGRTEVEPGLGLRPGEARRRLDWEGRNVVVGRPGRRGSTYHLVPRRRGLGEPSGGWWVVLVCRGRVHGYRGHSLVPVLRLDSAVLGSGQRLGNEAVVGRLHHDLVVLVKIEISDMLRSGELGSAWSGVVEVVAIVVVEVCKFSLSSRIAPHVGRGDAKVHFVFRFYRIITRWVYIRSLGASSSFLRSYIFNF